MPLLALAAAIAFSAWLAPTSVRRWLTGTSDGREMQALMRAVSQESTRPVTGRLSGGFAYAPPPSSIRGGEASRMVSPEVRVAAAAIEGAAPRQGADGQAALGVAYLVSGDLDAATAALEAATAQEPGNSSWWNDLAVAYLARGERSRGAADATRALEASDRSLRLSPDSPEAAFNRALALTQLGRLDDAASSWSAAERLSSGSPWAAEAATHRSPGSPRP
jgi:tetratricopeptide (TPR) repeat protein